MRMTMLALLAVCGLCVAADTQPAKKTWVEEMVAKIPADLLPNEKDDDVDASKRVIKLNRWWQQNTVGRRVLFVGTAGGKPRVELYQNQKVVSLGISADNAVREDKVFSVWCKVYLPHEMLDDANKFVGKRITASGVLMLDADSTIDYRNKKLSLPTMMATRNVKIEEPVAAK
jgi:hypothetical protein